MNKPLRIVIGIITMVAGIGFFLVPFLPIGYIILFIGAILLAPEIPLFKRLIKWLQTKDKSGRLKKVLKKLYQFTDNNEIVSEEHSSEKEKNLQ